jgi:hypothetical protein
MDRLPIWAQWALVPAFTVLSPILMRLAPEMLPVIILCLPIAMLVGQCVDEPAPVWRRDRA